MLEALLIGVIAAVPVGPVLLMIIQKTLTLGKRAALSAGVGSALADTVYAAIGLLTLSLIADFINAYQAVIMLFGAAIIGFIGVKILFKKVDLDLRSQDNDVSLVSHGLQTFTSAMSNPAALAFMLGLLAMFGLSSESSGVPIWALLLAVCAGESLYWFFVVYVLASFIHLKSSTLQMISRIAGVGICIFALILLVRGLHLLLV